MQLSADLMLAVIDYTARAHRFWVKGLEINGCQKLEEK